MLLHPGNSSLLSKDLPPISRHILLLDMQTSDGMLLDMNDPRRSMNPTPDPIGILFLEPNQILRIGFHNPDSDEILQDTIEFRRIPMSSDEFCIGPVVGFMDLGTSTWFSWTITSTSSARSSRRILE